MPCHYCYKNSLDATIWSAILQYGLTYTMQTWSHIYDAIRCEPSDVSGYLIQTSGCLIWHDLTALVFTVYGRGGHLCHVTSIMSSDFHFLVPESFHKKIVQIGTLVSEKIWFDLLYAHDLGPRSRNDFDLQYSHTFIYLFRCLPLLLFRSLAAMVSENPLFSLFPIEKPNLLNLTLP